MFVPLNGMEFYIFSCNNANTRSKQKKIKFLLTRESIIKNQNSGPGYRQVPFI